MDVPRVCLSYIKTSSNTLYILHENMSYIYIYLCICMSRWCITWKFKYFYLNPGCKVFSFCKALLSLIVLLWNKSTTKSVYCNSPVNKTWKIIPSLSIRKAILIPKSIDQSKCNLFFKSIFSVLDIFIFINVFSVCDVLWY